MDRGTSSAAHSPDLGTSLCGRSAVGRSWLYDRSMGDSAEEPQDKPTAYGQYVSTWKRQTDGVWKVVVDLGISHPAPAGNAKKPQPSTFNAGSEKTRRNVRIDEERSELLAFDRELANLVSEKGSAQAYLRFLADDARLYRENTFPVIGKREIFAMLSQSGGKLL